MVTDASGNVSFGGTAAMSSSFLRNRIINGDMRIDQRNAGASVTNTAGTLYTIDRWAANGAQASKFTIQQNAGSVTPPSGFVNYLGVTSSSAYSVLSTDSFDVRQIIEGLNVSDLAWGTASAATVTLSFWVRSSLTGTFGGALANGAFNRSYPFTYTISVANTWEQKTVTITGDTSGTWLTTNGKGLYVFLGLGAGSNYTGTAGAWTGSGLVTATGATSVVGTNGATFYVTGVQLEVGTVATPFERQIYSNQLAQCQRYFYKAGSDSAFENFGSGWATTASSVNFWVEVPTTMRAIPTLLKTGTIQAQNFNNAVYGTSSFSINSTESGLNRIGLSCSVVTATANIGYVIRAGNDTSATLQFSSEL